MIWYKYNFVVKMEANVLTNETGGDFCMKN